MFFKDKALAKIIIGIALAAFLYGSSIGINFVIIPLLFENSGASKSMIGLLMAADVCTPLFIMPVLPNLLSRFGMARVLFYAILIRNIMLSVICYFNKVQAWLPIMVMFGTGGFTMFTIMQLWINTACSNDNRGISLGTMNASLSLGMAIGPVVLNYIGVSGKLPFIVSSLICLVSLLPLYKIRKLMPINLLKAKTRVITVIRRAPLAIIGGITVDFIFYTMSSFLVLYGIENGLSTHDAAFLITAMLIGGIIFDIPMGWVSDRVNRSNMIVVCCIIILVCSQILPLIIHRYYQTILVLVIWCGAMSGIYTSSLSMLGDKFKGYHLSVANSTFAFMNCLGGITGVLVTGLAMDIFGHAGMPKAISIICVLSLFINIIHKLCFKRKPVMV